MTYEVEMTELFENWLASLKDAKASDAVLRSVRRIQAGLLGDNKPLGGGLFEIRIHCGPGYRLYFINRGKRWILLLSGSDKTEQKKAIKLAYAMAKEFKK